MLAVFKRELKAFFCGWRGYAFVAVFVLCSCAVRMVYNYMCLYDTIFGFINQEYILSFLPAALAFAVPILTFSMYREERKNGVFSFLRSLPIKEKDIFLGKYFASSALILITYTVMIAADIILGFYSGTNILTAVLGIFGFICIANVLLGVNMLFAVAIKNIYIALGLGYGVAFVLTALTATRYLLPMILTDIITPVSLFGAYTSLLFGLADISSFVLWLSLGMLFVCLSYFILGGIKGKGRIIISAAVAAVVVLNVAVGLIPDRYRRIDITSADSYTLSEDTKKYLRELDEKVTLNVIDADGSDFKYEYLLRRIDDASKNIDINWLSAEGAKELTDSLGVSDAVTPYFIVAESQKRTTAVSYYELISYYTKNTELASYWQSNEVSFADYETMKQMLLQYAEKNSQYAESYYKILNLMIYDTEMHFSGEPYLCRVIEYLTVDNIPTRYVLTGHGETVLSETEMGDYISSKVGLIYKALNVAEAQAIPTDAVSILVLNPKSDISAAEKDLLLSYLNCGGQMTVFTTEENLSATPNLMSVMRAYGMYADTGVVGEAVEISGENESAEKKYEYRATVEADINTAHKATEGLDGMSISPKITNGNDIKNVADMDLSGFTITPILTCENGYIGEDTASHAPRTLAALSEKQGGGTLLWLTGATSFTSPVFDENVDEETYMRVYSNISVIISSIGLAPLTYDSVVSVSASKNYEATLMSVTETNFVVTVIVSVVAVLILTVFGLILLYKRKKA